MSLHTFSQTATSNQFDNLIDTRRTLNVNPATDIPYVPFVFVDSTSPSGFGYNAHNVRDALNAAHNSGYLSDITGISDLTDALDKLITTALGPTGNSQNGRLNIDKLSEDISELFKTFSTHTTSDKTDQNSTGSDATHFDPGDQGHLSDGGNEKSGAAKGRGNLHYGLVGATLVVTGGKVAAAGVVAMVAPVPEPAHKVAGAVITVVGLALGTIGGVIVKDAVERVSDEHTEEGKVKDDKPKKGETREDENKEDNTSKGENKSEKDEENETDKGETVGGETNSDGTTVGGHSKKPEEESDKDQSEAPSDETNNSSSESMPTQPDGDYRLTRQQFDKIIAKNPNFNSGDGAILPGPNNNNAGREHFDKLVAGPKFNGGMGAILPDSNEDTFSSADLTHVTDKTNFNGSAGVILTNPNDDSSNSAPIPNEPHTGL